MMKVGLKAELDVSGIISPAGQAVGALDKITNAMKKVDVNKDPNTYAKLAWEKDRMQARTAGFSRDINKLASDPRYMGVGANGQPVFKIDQKYADLITKQIDIMKKLTDAYNNKLENGTPDEVMALGAQLTKEQAEFHKLINKATGGEEKSNTEKYVKSIFANQIAEGINSGINLWAASRDRSGIVNALGSGNVMQAQLQESQRKTDMATGIIDTAGSILQAALSFSPIPGGPLWGAGAKTATNFTSGLLRGWQNEKKTDVAFADQWENQTDQAMNLAAMMGETSKVRPTWKIAADTAAEYGFAAEEGMEALKQAVSQGLGKEAVDKVFGYERATGVDRGALSSLAYMSERYGNGDAMAAAWRGLNASGMKTGQYGELLRGLEKTISDGIAKGYVVSSEKVAQNLTMLSQMTNGNELWKGEMGARRLEKMNSGLAGTVGLNSTADMIAFRAAGRVKGYKDASYIEKRALLERGLNDDQGGELLQNIWDVIKEIHGEDDTESLADVLQQIFGFTNNEVLTFMKSYNPEMSTTQAKIAMDNARALPTTRGGTGEGEIPELGAKIESMRIRNATIDVGMMHWDKGIWDALLEAQRESLKHKTKNNKDYSAGTADEINYEYGHLTKSFFGNDGDAASDATAIRQFNSMVNGILESKDTEQFAIMEKVFNDLNYVKKSGNAGDWDRYDVLNTITNSNNINEFITRLDRMIQLLDEGKTAEEINFEIINKR